MAIYGNAVQNSDARHCIAESSRLRATDVGRIYDVIVRDASSKEIEVDNGALLKLGAFTGDGLQTQYATVAGTKDKAILALSVPIIKDSYSTQSAQTYNFYNKKGEVVRAYELVPEDIFGVSKEFVTGTIAVGSYVKWDASAKKYAISSTDPSSTNGFVAKVHSIQVGTFYDLVRLVVVQNTTIA